MTTYPTKALRIELLQRLAEAREETDRMFGILTPAALYDRPIPERHRVVFYIGHLEAFDWNLLRTHLGLDRFHPEYDQLFAFGIDPIDGGLPADQPADWPNIKQVENYRSKIRQELDSALMDSSESEELINLMHIAIEHRYMHAETLEYMFHQLPFASKCKPVSVAPPQARDVTPRMVEIPAGAATLGLVKASGMFGWDNEFEAFSVDVPAFRIDQYKVSNGQFLKFLEAGGYNNRALWTEADWEWRQHAGISRPVFWVPSEGGFRYRSMFEEIALPLTAPVFVSHAEARAYAKWVGHELPTEAQWHRAAAGAQPPHQMRVLWDPPPAGAAPELKSACGVEDLLGTAWEWTSSKFEPFPGFQIMPSYPGYSANFFDGKHFVIKGGSTRTAASILRTSFRNWFQAHYQYVYAGFRCVSHS